MRLKLLMLLLTGIIGLEATDIKKEEPKVQEWKIQNDPYYINRKSQFEVLTMNEKYTTMMLGDSITDEGLWDELLNNDKVFFSQNPHLLLPKTKKHLSW